MLKEAKAGIIPLRESLIRERCFGVFEGRPSSHLRAAAKEAGLDVVDYSPEGGETLKQCQHRANMFCDHLCQSVGGNTAEKKTRMEGHSCSFHGDKSFEQLSPVESTESPTLNTRISGQPTLNTRVSGQPTLNTGVSGQPTLNTRVSGQPTLNTRVSGQPTLNTGVSGQPTLNTRVSGQPTLNTRVSGQPTLNTGVSGQPTLNTRVSGQPTLNTRSSGQPTLNTGVSGQPTLNTGVSGQPTLNTRVSGQPTLNTRSSGQPTLNTGVSGQPTVSNGFDFTPSLILPPSSDPPSSTSMDVPFNNGLEMTSSGTCNVREDSYSMTNISKEEIPHIAVVTHGGFMRCLFRHFYDKHACRNLPSKSYKTTPPNTSLNSFLVTIHWCPEKKDPFRDELDKESGEWKVLRMECLALHDVQHV